MRKKKSKKAENQFHTEEIGRVRIRGILKRDWQRKWKYRNKEIPNGWELWMEEAIAWRKKHYVPPRCWIELDPPVLSNKCNRSITIQFRTEPKALIGMPDNTILSLDVKYEPWGNGLGGHISYPTNVEVIPQWLD